MLIIIGCKEVRFYDEQNIENSYSGVIDVADTNRGYCYIFCYSYSSTPSKRPIYFISSSSYDTVTITNDNQSPSLYYKPSVKNGERIVVDYSVTGSDSRVIANGSIDG